MSRIVKRLAASVMAVLAGGAVVLSTAGAAHADPPTALTAASCTRAAQYTSGGYLANYVPVTSSPSINCSLAQGNNSGAVTGLQDNLRICYGRDLTSDGNFGPATRNALIYAQGRMGVTQDGIYGPNTRARMKMYFTLSGTTPLCTVWGERSWRFDHFQY